MVLAWISCAVAIGAARSAEPLAADAPRGPGATRIVSLAPSLTEELVFLGARAQLVGRTRFCVWPRGEVETIPVVGGIADPELETLLALQPDLVVATDMTPQTVVQRLTALGLRVVVRREQGIPGIFTDLAALAELTGPGDTAHERITSLRARYDAIVQAAAAIPEAQRPRVLVLYGLQSLHSAARGTFPSGIIEAAGGRNVVEGTSSAWPTLGLEQIAAWNPDVMLIATDHPGDEPATRAAIAALADRPVWRSIRAVQDGRVELVGDSLLSIPGPRTIAAIEHLARSWHPHLAPAEPTAP